MTKPATVAGQRIKSFVDRIENLEEERKAIGGDIRDIYAEAKGTGYDVKTIRWLVQERKVDSADRDERDSLRDVYANALGMAVSLVQVNGLSLREASRQSGVSKSSIHRALAVPAVSHEPGNSAHEGEGDGERNANDGGDGRRVAGNGDGQPVRDDRREPASASARTGHDGVGTEPIRATARDADELPAGGRQSRGGAPAGYAVVSAPPGDDHERRGEPAGASGHAPSGTSVANREEDPTKEYTAGPEQGAVSNSLPPEDAPQAGRIEEPPATPMLAAGASAGTSIEQEAPAAGEGEKRNGPTEEAVSNVLRVSGGVADLAAGAHGNLPNGDGQDTHSVASDRIMREESENVNADCNHAVEIAATNDCGQETGSATVVATGNLDALSPDIPTHAAGGLQPDACSTGEDRCLSGRVSGSDEKETDDVHVQHGSRLGIEVATADMGSPHVRGLQEPHGCAEGGRQEGQPSRLRSEQGRVLEEDREALGRDREEGRHEEGQEALAIEEQAHPTPPLGAIAEGDSPQRVARQKDVPTEHTQEDDLEIPHFLRRNGTGSALRAPHPDEREKAAT